MVNFLFLQLSSVEQPQIFLLKFPFLWKIVTLSDSCAMSSNLTPARVLEQCFFAIFLQPVPLLKNDTLSGQGEIRPLSLSDLHEPCFAMVQRVCFMQFSVCFPTRALNKVKFFGLVCFGFALKCFNDSHSPLLVLRIFGIARTWHFLSLFQADSDVLSAL